MNYFEEYKEQIEVFIGVCHRLSHHLYATSEGGNLAWKLAEDVILITPTQLNKGHVQADDVVFIDGEGKTLAGRNRPTGETPMYLNFFRERPDVRSAIHCHPPMTGAFAITAEKNLLMRPIFPETTTEVGPVPVVPYGQPLSQRLADNFLPYLQKYNAFLMENHGLVILSRRDIRWTMLIIEMLETTATSVLSAAAVGAVKEISREDVRELDEIMKVRNLPMFGAPGHNSSLEELYF